MNAIAFCIVCTGKTGAYCGQFVYFVVQFKNMSKTKRRPGQMGIAQSKNTGHYNKLTKIVLH